MFPDLITFHQGCAFLAPDFPSAFWDLGFLKASLTSKDRSKKAFRTSSFSMSCHQGPCTTQQQAHTSATLSLFIEVLLAFFDIPGQIHLQVGFGFSHCIFACSEIVSIFLPGYLSLLLPSVYALFMSEFFQEFPVHHASLPASLLDILLIGMDCSEA